MIQGINQAKFVTKTANLSDLASPSGARFNLGLGSIATQPSGQFVSYVGATANLNLGTHALSANQLSIAGGVVIANDGSISAGQDWVINGDGSASLLSLELIEGVISTPQWGIDDTGLFNGSIALSHIIGAGSIATQPSGQFIPYVGATANLNLGTHIITGNGSGLVTLNASGLAYGTVNPARLGTGTANSTTFLRGDNVWSTPSFASTLCVVTNSSPQSFDTDSDFTRCNLDTIVADPGNRFSTSNHWYTVPTSGIYLIVTKFRLEDGETANVSYGQGAGTTEDDGSHFAWFQTNPTAINGNTRNGSINTRINSFNTGEQIRMYAYIDNDSLMPVDENSMEMNIIRIA